MINNDNKYLFRQQRTNHIDIMSRNYINCNSQSTLAVTIISYGLKFSVWRIKTKWRFRLAPRVRKWHARRLTRTKEKTRPFAGNKRASGTKNIFLPSIHFRHERRWCRTIVCLLMVIMSNRYRSNLFQISNLLRASFILYISVYLPYSLNNSFILLAICILTYIYATCTIRTYMIKIS